MLFVSFLALPLQFYNFILQPLKIRIVQRKRHNKEEHLTLRTLNTLRIVQRKRHNKEEHLFISALAIYVRLPRQ